MGESTQIAKPKRLLGLPIWAWLVALGGVLLVLGLKSRRPEADPHDLDAWL